MNRSLLAGLLCLSTLFAGNAAQARRAPSNTHPLRGFLEKQKGDATSGTISGTFLSLMAPFGTIYGGFLTRDSARALSSAKKLLRLLTAVEQNDTSKIKHFYKRHILHPSAKTYSSTGGVTYSDFKKLIADNMVEAANFSPFLLYSSLLNMDYLSVRNMADILSLSPPVWGADIQSLSKWTYDRMPTEAAFYAKAYDERLRTLMLTSHTHFAWAQKYLVDHPHVDRLEKALGSLSRLKNLLKHSGADQKERFAEVYEKQLGKCRISEKEAMPAESLRELIATHKGSRLLIYILWKPCSVSDSSCDIDTCNALKNLSRSKGQMSVFMAEAMRLQDELPRIWRRRLFIANQNL